MAAKRPFCFSISTLPINAIPAKVVVEQIFLSCLAILLLIAAISDLRRYIIPNWLNIAITTLFIVHSMIAPPGWTVLALQIGSATFIFLIGFLLFNKGLFGGGDVKLLACLTLWVGLAALPRLILTMTLAGGVLALIILALRRYWRSDGGVADRRIPYGVAIALAGFDFCLHQTHLVTW